MTREFLERVEKAAAGVTALKAVSPAQQLVKIVYDELVAMLGERSEGLQAQLRPADHRDAGRAAGLREDDDRGQTRAQAAQPRAAPRRLVAADVYRPAAIDQLETLGAQLASRSTPTRDTTDVVRIAKQGIEQARKARDRVVILDTAGRLQIDEEMMRELTRLKDAVHPDEILLVADGMTGQDAVQIAQGFDSALGVTGVILTKMDGDARGGAALSIYGVLKKPIKYIGVGEKTDALEEFHPDRMASRILQMGDVLTLVEKAQATFDEDEAKKLEKKVRKEGMDLQDFLSAMRQMQKLGPLEGILKMLPGVNTKMLKQANVDPQRLKHLEAIVLSMTPDERHNPGILNGSRRARVAKGSGRPISEVNRLLEQFRDMQKMMKKAGSGGGRDAGLAAGDAGDEIGIRGQGSGVRVRNCRATRGI